MTMGSADQTHTPDSFEDTKIRINSAFEYLRNEMKEIQRQDIMLLKQLMYIRHTILLLSNYPDRRSYSISALDPPGVTSPEEIAQRRRPSLTRVQSAPLERNVSEDTIPEEEEEDEGPQDTLAQSFNSSVADTLVTGGTRCPSPETDFIYALSPLPPVFRRLLESAAPPGISSDPQDPSHHTQHLLRELNRSQSPTCRDNSLHQYVTRRKMLQRQGQVGEAEGTAHPGKHRQRLLDEGESLHKSTHLRLSPQSSSEIEV